MFNAQSEYILIDIGSHTVKIYKYKENQLIHLKNITIDFKKNFDPITGIDNQSKQKLLDLLTHIKAEYNDLKINLYATAVFRKQTKEQQQKLKDEVYDKTGLYFNIIDHQTENTYLQHALIDKCPPAEPILLINIGGGSTELVVVQNGQPIEKHNIEIGVGTINSIFVDINKPTSETPLNTILQWIQKQFPVLENNVSTAIYSGGELTYMQKVDYPLEPNTVFIDADHPSQVSTKAFANKNQEVFHKIPLTTLEAYMPENPQWMHGARGCSVIAQAICQKYTIQLIIPSDADLIHGVIRQQYEQVTLSGSFRKHLDYILNTKRELEMQKVKIMSPRFEEPKNPGEEFVVFTGEEGLTPLQLERHHLQSIQKSDALIVCNPNGYVGASALIEVGYAQALDKRIIYTEKPEEFMLNTLPGEVGM